MQMDALIREAQKWCVPIWCVPVLGFSVHIFPNFIYNIPTYIEGFFETLIYRKKLSTGFGQEKDLFE